MGNLLKYLSLSSIYKLKKAHDFSLEHVRGYIVSSCLVSLLNIGFFDELSRYNYININGFSKKHDIGLQTIKALCKYLYAIGILRRKKGNYCLSAKGQILIYDAIGPFNFISAYSPIFQNLEAMLRKEKKYGKDIIRRSEFVAKASAETERWIPFPVIEKLIRTEKYNSILDLGCGSAEFLIRLCKRIPNIKAFGIDISESSIAYAKKRLKEERLEKSIKLEVSDIFEVNKLSKEMKEVDVITSFFVLHELVAEGREKVIRLLKTLKENFVNSSLVICELYRKAPTELKRKPSMIAEHHLFHALSNQKILSVKEWKNIIKKTDYKIKNEIKFNVAGQVYFILE